MEKKKYFHLFAKYAAWNTFGTIGISCYILADTYFVSKAIGPTGLTALNLAIPVYSLIYGCGLMFGIGGSAKYSILRGQNKKEEANEIVTHTIKMTAVCAFLFFLLGFCCSKEITGLVGANEEVFAMTHIYLKVLLLFAPAFMMNNVCQCFVRNDGNPRLAMIAMLLGSGVNIIFDYIFLFPMQMGIFGAVLATGFSPVFSLCILSIHRRKAQLGWKKGNIKLQAVKAIVSLGAASLCTEVASGIVMLVFNVLILRMKGNMGVAAYGIVANFAIVVISIYNGIAQGTQPLLSRAYGEQKYDGIRYLIKNAVMTILFLSLLIYAFSFASADILTALFNKEGDIALQQMAVQGLKLYFLGFPFAGLNIVLAMYFTATEKAVPAQVLSLSRGFFVMIPMTLLLAYVFQMAGIWLAYVVTESIVSFVGIVWARKMQYHFFS